MIAIFVAVLSVMKIISKVSGHEAPNARINRAGINCIVRQVDDDRQADSAPVQ